jgi:ribonucleoside-diphosphate reductase alpha chain
MKIQSLFTGSSGDPYQSFLFNEVVSEIRNFDGSQAHENIVVVAPSHWSQNAVDIVAKKYFRRAGVPAILRRVPEEGVPTWLWRSVADDEKLQSLPHNQRFGRERDIRQVFDRIAGASTYWGWKSGCFSTEADAAAFFAELRFMLAAQMVAPNSPQWFNAGLHWAYGIEGPAQGHWHVDDMGEARRSANAYERPQMHSCFIQSVDDDLINPGGVLPLMVDEARIAKYGSGTGANFSRIRGAAEPLSNGGMACGLVAVLRATDRAAALVTANGSTRRASKMVIVDIDHPDVEEFIAWKVKEEQKVAALVTGSRVCARHLTAIIAACVEHEGAGAYDASTNPRLRREIRSARHAHVPENYIRRSLGKGMRQSISRSSTRTGTPKLISPSPARTGTTRFASPTLSCAASTRMEPGP